MTACTPLLGARSGSLSVIEEPSYAAAAKVHVLCDCGRSEWVHRQRLRAGKYKACSVCQPRHDPAFKPALGKRFGKLEVIEESETGHKRRVLCRCDCGRQKLIAVHTLREGRAKTCGACNRSFDRLKSVLGQTFGKLTVIAEPEICRNRRVTCRCECGKVVSRLLANLKRGQTKSCGCTKWYNHKFGCVYLLLDPITDAVRYVGQTVQQLGVRLSGHIYSQERRGRAFVCVQKKAWVSSLRPLRPKIIAVEAGVPVDQLDVREQFYIEKYLSLGADLLNIQHTKVAT